MMYSQDDFLLWCHESIIPPPPKFITPRFKHKYHIYNRVVKVPDFKKKLKSATTGPTALPYIPKLLPLTQSISRPKRVAKDEKKQHKMLVGNLSQKEKLTDCGIGNCFVQKKNLNTPNTYAPSIYPYSLSLDRTRTTRSPSQMREEQRRHINETSSNSMNFTGRIQKDIIPKLVTPIARRKHAIFGNDDLDFKSKCSFPLVLPPIFTKTQESSVGAMFYKSAKLEGENIHMPDKIKNDQNKAHVLPSYMQQSLISPPISNEDISWKDTPRLYP